MKKQAIKLNKNYIVVESWMSQDLGLSGNELLVYAIIYGFSQAKNQICCCGDDYIATWLNTSSRSIIRIKKQLKERNLIEQIENVVVSGVGAQQDNRRLGYRAIVPQLGDKMSPNLPEIGDKMSCISDKIGDKMSCIIKKYMTKYHEIGDKMSRASLDNTKYNIKNNYNTQHARACAREGGGFIRIVSEGDHLSAFPTDEDTAIGMWLEIRNKLELDVNSLGFDVWLKPLMPLGFCDDLLILQAPTKSAANEVEHRYLPMLNDCVRKLL